MRWFNCTSVSALQNVTGTRQPFQYGYTGATIMSPKIIVALCKINYNYLINFTSLALAKQKIPRHQSLGLTKTVKELLLYHHNMTAFSGDISNIEAKWKHFRNKNCTKVVNILCEGKSDVSLGHDLKGDDRRW